MANDPNTNPGNVGNIGIHIMAKGSHTICFTCGQEWHIEDGPHDCPMAKKLDTLERHIVAALFQADFCDHFCCGLSDTACKAKTISQYLIANRLVV